MKLTQDALNYMLVFEKKTGVSVKDCVSDNNSVTFIVKKGGIGAAIGKGGITVNKIKEDLGKEVHVYEYSNDVKQFIKNLLFPVKVEKVELNNKMLKIHIKQSEKKRAIGKGGKKINTAKELLKRHFDINEIKVL